MRAPPLQLKRVTVQDVLNAVRDLYDYDYRKVSTGDMVLPASPVSLCVRSATAMTRTQASAIAAPYLDEILPKRYVEDGVEASRQQYDDVRDYAGLDEMGARSARRNRAFNTRPPVY